ncbi:MAG: hypothetical protein ACE5I1_30730 [bacterium]
MLNTDPKIQNTGKSMFCFHCKKEIAEGTKIFRQSVCENCGSYLRCCLNCKNHDPVAYNQCREPMAEIVKEKDKANFCDYFDPKKEEPEENMRAEEARQRLEALFKKKDS